MRKSNKQRHYSHWIRQEKLKSSVWCLLILTKTPTLNSSLLPICVKSKCLLASSKFMCPIHETDRAQERWSRDEWKYLELWEKLEQRLKKFKRYWIYATIIVFLILSSIPVVMERLPHWKALRLSRSLAEEVAHLKLLTSTTRKAHRLKFLDHNLLVFQIEAAPSCISTEEEFTSVRAGSLGSDHQQNNIVLLNSEQAKQNQIPGVLTSICYDPVTGAQGLSKNEDLAGFALIPVKDLTEMRMDRIAILLLTGPSAEISFN